VETGTQDGALVPVKFLARCASRGTASFNQKLRVWRFRFDFGSVKFLVGRGLRSEGGVIILEKKVNYQREEKAMKVLVLFYSTYGHLYRMAQAIADGAKDVEGAEVEIRRVPETLPEEVLQKMGATDAQKGFSHIPIATVEDLVAADAVIFGTPTRFGGMCGQMRQFLDSTGQLWQEGKLVGKAGSVFTSTATQHGGQEATLLSFHTSLLHHGMVIVGLPYQFKGQMRIDEITGCSPYGASTIAGTSGERMPSENELLGARFQGKHVATIAKKLSRESTDN
jgi:NAD(P)H dehydrogenase (quinone)